MIHSNMQNFLLEINKCPGNYMFVRKWPLFVVRKNCSELSVSCLIVLVQLSVSNCLNSLICVTIHLLVRYILQQILSDQKADEWLSQKSMGIWRDWEWPSASDIAYNHKAAHQESRRVRRQEQFAPRTGGVKTWSACWTEIETRRHCHLHHLWGETEECFVGWHLRFMVLRLLPPFSFLQMEAVYSSEVLVST